MQRLGSRSSTVRAILRHATDAVHERLHQAEPFAAIAYRRLSRAGYAELLGRIAAFHFTIDAEPGESRRALLSADLDALAAPPPPRLAWNAPASRAGRLGCAYVVAGSSLGGRVIYRQLDYLFGDSPEGRSFFRGSPADGARWRALCSRLEAEGAVPGAVDRMIAGAEAAFALFERAIEPAYAHG